MCQDAFTFAIHNTYMFILYSLLLARISDQISSFIHLLDAESTIELHNELTFLTAQQ